MTPPVGMTKGRAWLIKTFFLPRNPLVYDALVTEKEREAAQRWMMSQVQQVESQLL
jgi:hypothetical protein